MNQVNLQFNEEHVEGGLKTAKLSAVLPLSYGKAKSAEAGFPYGDAQVFGSNGPFGTIDKAITRGAAIIVGRKGAAGAVHYSQFPCWPTDTAYFSEGRDGLDLKFFYYLLSSLNLSSFDRSTAIPSLSRDDYNNITISYPSSPDLQGAIVSEIEKQFSRLDAGIAALKRAQANLKRYRASVLKAACEGRLVANEVENTRINGLPKGWHASEIQEFLSPGKNGMKTGPFGSLLQKHEHQLVGIPVLGIENIGRNLRFVHGSKIHISDEKATYLAGYDIQPNDVIISRSGTVGELTVVPIGLGPARFSTNLMRLRLNQNKCSSKFFAILFDGSPYVLSQVDELCKGSTRSFLNQHILKSMTFPIPPLDEQERIIAEVERRLSVADAVEASLNQQLIRATRLRQAILTRAFTLPGI